jgi:hypothetical protein
VTGLYCDLYESDFLSKLADEDRRGQDAKLWVVVCLMMMMIVL